MAYPYPSKPHGIPGTHWNSRQARNSTLHADARTVATEVNDFLGPRYLSIPALGNHPDAAPRQWKLLDRDAASAALDLLVDRYLAGDHPVLLLCAEPRAADCHRRLVADHLRKRLLLRVPEAIVEVRHLL